LSPKFKCHLYISDLPPPYPGIVHKPPHAIRAEDRKFSAPVLGTKEYQSARDRQIENRLSRCDEMENIPTSVQEEPEMAEFHLSVNR
jgi:hypothetical protein